MNALLFDLDGTLTDSAPGIIKSVKYALESMQAPIPSDEILQRFLGPPLWESFPAYCQFDDFTTKEAVRLYREYYAVNGIYDQVLYAGIPELIFELHQAGLPLFVATAKPDMYAGKILEHMKLDHLFVDICGASADNSRADKTSIIGHVITKHGLNPKASWMIGDKEHDIHAAHAHSMKSIACLYGYGMQDDLEQSEPTHMCSSVQDLRDILLNLQL